jgi:hypothetical protein
MWPWGVGEVHLDQVVAHPAVDAQPEGPVRGVEFEGGVVREARPAEVDLDGVLAGPPSMLMSNSPDSSMVWD